MKSKFKLVFSVITIIVFVLILSACQPQTIVFKGVELRVSELSSSTIEWINYYNSLTEEEQNLISYLPIELRNYLPNDDNTLVSLNKRESFIGKVIRIDEENKKVLVSSDKLYWCNYENVEKLKNGYIVEVFYNSYIEEEDYFTISPESLTIVSATYDLVGVYLDAILTIWEDSEETEKGYYNLVLDFSELFNLSDADKNALIYEVKSALGVVVKVGSTADLKDDDVCIKITYKIYEEITEDSEVTVENASIEVQIDESAIPQHSEGLIENIEVDVIEDVHIPVSVEMGEDNSPAVQEEGILPEISVSTNESSIKVLFLFDIVKLNKAGELRNYKDCMVKAEGSEIFWVKG